MPPRRRQAATRTAEAYNYAGAEKLNNPTSETALGMEPKDLADQFIPEPEEEGRNGSDTRGSSGTGGRRPTIPGPSGLFTSTTKSRPNSS